MFVLNVKRAEGGFSGQVVDGKRQSVGYSAVPVDATLLQVPCRVSEKYCRSARPVSHPGSDVCLSVCLTAELCICLV